MKMPCPGQVRECIRYGGKSENAVSGSSAKVSIKHEGKSKNAVSGKNVR